MFDAPQPRRFAVHTGGDEVSRALVVMGDGFMDAALQFLEDHHPGADDEVSLCVEDLETGERQSFRIDLGDVLAQAHDKAA